MLTTVLMQVQRILFVLAATNWPDSSVFEIISLQFHLLGKPAHRNDDDDAHREEETGSTWSCNHPEHVDHERDGAHHHRHSTSSGWQEGEWETDQMEKVL